MHGSVRLDNPLALNRRVFLGKAAAGTSMWATCPVACTPVSVRPAAQSRTGVRKTVVSASSMTPATVRCPA